MEATEALGVVGRLRSWESRQARLGGLATESVKYGRATCESEVMSVFQLYRRDAEFLLNGVQEIVKRSGNEGLATAWARAKHWVLRANWLDIHDDFVEWQGVAVLSKDAVRDLTGMRRAVWWFCTDLSKHLSGTPEVVDVGERV